MFRCILFFNISMILNMAASQTPNLISTATWPLPSTQTYEEQLSSIVDFQNITLSKKDKFYYLINLFKTVLSEEFENAQVHITNQDIKNSTFLPVDIMGDQHQIKSYDDDDEMIEKQDWKSENNISASEIALYDEIMTKIAAALSKTKIYTANIQSKEGLPNAAPTFRPKPLLNQHFAEKLNTGTIARQTQSPIKVVSTADQNVQANYSPNVMNVPLFTIPCHRASDILEIPSNIAIPKQAFCENVANVPNQKTTANSITQTPKHIQDQNVAPVTLSVDYADLDDTVAMIFKPKAVSLMQLYGNILKKITVTVLVPYSISKLSN